MKKRKIVYITGTRAEYGLMQSTLKAINSHPSLELELIVTGTHLSGVFGYTIKDILKDDFKIHTIQIPEVTDGLSMAHSFGEAVIIFSKLLKKINPDILLLEGDRYEALAGAIAGAFLNIVVAHVSGGDVSGSIDDSIRHSITKFAHIHFPGTPKSAERIIKMGENSKYVFMVGTPGIEKHIKPDKNRIAKKFGLDPKKPVFLVIQHAVKSEEDKAGWQIKQTLEAVSAFNEQIVIIYSNNDPGSQDMIKEIEKYRKNRNVRIHKNIPRADFHDLMSISAIMIGNSSCGLTESPMFGLPVINIGIRQKGRERGGNVIDCSQDINDIKKAIKKALSGAFKEKIKRMKNPYKSDKTAEKISDILAKIKLDKKLLDKRLTY
jgi:UDP-hydrolysing UDP-N-acetyl-D-glucosamine 2-epimerase